MSTTAAQAPIFSEEFYTHQQLFTDRNALDLNAFKVNAQGTIAYTPSARTSPSIFKEFKRMLSYYFGFTQSANLIAVHKKLLSLDAQMQDPAHPLAVQLKRELHGRHFTTVSSNIACSLSYHFEEANKTSAAQRTMLKVVNFVRRLFCLQPIVHYHFSMRPGGYHTPIHDVLWSRRLENTPIYLTEQERLSTRHVPQIQNNSNCPLPANLTQDTLLALELGLTRAVTFHIDEKEFEMTYDSTRGKFILSYFDARDFHPFLGTHSLIPHEEYTSPPLHVRETQASGGVQLHALQYTGNFLSLARHRPGRVEMSANSDYTIPLSQGNLTISLPLRVQ